jgi:hypothetical protein
VKRRLCLLLLELRDPELTPVLFDLRLVGCSNPDLMMTKTCRILLFSPSR